MSCASVAARRSGRADRPNEQARNLHEQQFSMVNKLLEVANLGKRFGGFVALEQIELSVEPGERLGLIGPNGSGKSTLVNCICGTLRNEAGTVRFDGMGLDRLPAHRRTRLGLA